MELTVCFGKKPETVVAAVASVHVDSETGLDEERNLPVSPIFAARFGAVVGPLLLHCGKGDWELINDVRGRVGVRDARSKGF